VFYRISLAAPPATVAAVGAATSSPYAWIVGWMPVVIGVIMVILVRSILDMKAKKKEAWNYNVLVMGLCSIVTAVFVHEWAMTPGQATLFGMGVGAAGVGVIKWGGPTLAYVMQKGADGLNGRK
jgi:heme/copper-type cytochrome/quinol oxidase subunit 4